MSDFRQTYSMHRKMIIVSASSDCGNSSLLRVVINNIQWEELKYYNTKRRPLEIKDGIPYDYITIGIPKNSDKKVAIATFGDSAQAVRSNLVFLGNIRVIL